MTLDLQALTLFVFSTENWRRSASEVRSIHSVLAETLMCNREILKRLGVRVHILGDSTELPTLIRKATSDVQRLTRQNRELDLCLAVNYGGQDDLVRAIRRIISDGVEPHNVTRRTVSDYLSTRGLPEPDIVIRTGGDSRLSNFYLYQIAYSELSFTPTLWPDFTIAEYGQLLTRSQVARDICKKRRQALSGSDSL